MLEPLNRCPRDSTLFQFTTKRLRDFIDPDHLLIQVDERLDFAKLVVPLGGAVLSLLRQTGNTPRDDGTSAADLLAVQHRLTSRCRRTPRPDNSRRTRSTRTAPPGPWRSATASRLNPRHHRTTQMRLPLTPLTYEHKFFMIIRTSSRPDTPARSPELAGIPDRGGTHGPDPRHRTPHFPPLARRVAVRRGPVPLGFMVQDSPRGLAYGGNPRPSRL